jgi:hypothetical protein
VVEESLPPPLPPSPVEEPPEEEPDEKPKRKRRPVREDRDDDDDDRSPRGRAKKGVPVWVWGIIAAGVLLPLTCCGGLFTLGFFQAATEQDNTERGDVSTKGGNASAPGVVQLDERNLVDFVDHPETFKGKTLRIKARLDSPIFAGRGDSLRNYAGKRVEFFASGDKSAHLTLFVTLPRDQELPNATSFNDLIIEFVCREGKTDSGNEALSVKRP